MAALILENIKLVSQAVYSNKICDAPNRMCDHMAGSSSSSLLLSSLEFSDTKVYEP